MDNSKELYIKKIWEEGAVIVRKEPIKLKSGRESYIYVNHRNFVCQPENMKFMISLLKNEIDKIIFSSDVAICNVDSSLSPIIVGALSYYAGIPMYIYRPSSFEKGIVGNLFGYHLIEKSKVQEKLPAVLIDDVVTTATTITKAATTLEYHDIRVEGGLTIVDRRTKKDKEGEHVKVYSVISLEEIIKYGLENKNQLGLDEEDLRNLKIEIRKLQE